jgi:hypothetical protein
MAVLASITGLRCGATGAQAGLVTVERRGPAGEEFERVLGWGAGFGAEVGQGESGVGRERHRLEAEVHVADDGVVEVFDPGVV